MDVEESIRGNPIDGVVLLMGCDKTTPSLLMGAASCDLPTIGLSGGPMLSGKFRGRDLGSGTGLWQMTDQVRTGEMKVEEFFEAESCMHRSNGHCMTMGTASTMASMAEALGMSLPGNAAIPAVDARRNTLAQRVQELSCCAEFNHRQTQIVTNGNSLPRTGLERSRVAADAFACWVSAVWVKG
jgi:L-arabonate dehydrase